MLKLAGAHVDSLLCVDHSHGPVLVPATRAALPSTRAIPDRDVFYVADPISSIPLFDSQRSRARSLGPRELYRLSAGFPARRIRGRSLAPRCYWISSLQAL
jgi:hypothetical protein